MLKETIYYVKELLKGKTKHVETCGDIVSKVDWAKEEIEEAEKALLELSHRLHDGVVEMTKAAEEAEAIIERHKEILQQAKSRRAELAGKSQRVNDLLQTIEKIKE